MAASNWLSKCRRVVLSATDMNCTLWFCQCCGSTSQVGMQDTRHCRLGEEALRSATLVIDLGEGDR